MVLNAVAWCLFLLIRAPLSHEYFSKRDPQLNGGMWVLSSGDPVLVIAERPLFSWSKFHGGEHVAVKLLEAANLMPLVGAVVVSILLHGGSISLVAQSYVVLVVLLALSTLQWWGWTSGAASAAEVESNPLTRG